MNQFGQALSFATQLLSFTRLAKRECTEGSSKLGHFSSGRKYKAGLDVKLTWSFATKRVLSVAPDGRQCAMSDVTSSLNGRLILISSLWMTVF